MREPITLNIDKMKNSKISKLLSKEQVMEKCGISNSTLHKWMYKMDLKFMKFGNGKNSSVKFR